MRLWGHVNHLVMKCRSMELSGAKATGPVSGFGSVKSHGTPAQSLSQAGREHSHLAAEAETQSAQACHFAALPWLGDLAHLSTGPEPDAIRTVTQIGGWRPWAREPGLPGGAPAPATTDRGVKP